MLKRPWPENNEQSSINKQNTCVLMTEKENNTSNPSTYFRPQPIKYSQAKWTKHFSSLYLVLFFFFLDPRW